MLRYVPDHLKTKTRCDRVIEKNPYMLRYAPDYFKTRKMCEGVFEKYPWTLKYVPNWFVTQQQIGLWHDYHCPRHCTYHNNEMIKWYDGYKKRKAKKALTKEELIPVTWHPSRYWDWYMSEDEKKEIEKLWE